MKLERSWAEYLQVQIRAFVHCALLPDFFAGDPPELYEMFKLEPINKLLHNVEPGMKLLEYVQDCANGEYIEDYTLRRLNSIIREVLKDND